MKKHFFALLAGLCTAGAVYPQGADTAAIPSERWTQQAFADSVESQNKYFAVTFAGKVLPCSEVGYKNKLFIVDSVQVDPGTIAFFKNATGFYANANMAHNQTKSVFPQRVSKGKVNLYERQTLCFGPIYGSPSIGGYTGGSFNSGYYYGGGGPETKTVLYYNTGWGDLKLAKYKSLRHDLADNPESVKHLDRYHLMSQVQVGLLIGGCALVAGGLIDLANKTFQSTVDPSYTNDRDITGDLVLMVVGSICTTVSINIIRNKPEHLRLALDAYNR